MAGKTEICNLALMRLGTGPIESLDDTSKEARALKNCFELARDIVLRGHPWNFAGKRAALARLSAVPAFGYAYAFQLPVDQLRVLGLVDESGKIDPTLDYQIEGNLLLTNQTSASIRYIEKVTDPGRWDALFCSALSARLASEVAYHLTGSAAMKKQMMNEYLVELGQARSIDAQENPPEVYETNPWMDERL